MLSKQFEAIDCPTRKRQYTLERHAIKHILRMDVRQNEVLVPYICPYCNYWHVGHQKRC